MARFVHRERLTVKGSAEGDLCLRCAQPLPAYGLGPTPLLQQPPANGNTDFAAVSLVVGVAFVSSLPRCLLGWFFSGSAAVTGTRPPQLRAAACRCLGVLFSSQVSEFLLRSFSVIRSWQAHACSEWHPLRLRIVCGSCPKAAVEGKPAATVRGRLTVSMTGTPPPGCRTKGAWEGQLCLCAAC